MNLSPETISKAIGLSEELSKALSDLRYRLNAVQCNPTPETADQVFNAGGIVGQVAEELQETCEFFGSVSIADPEPAGDAVIFRQPRGQVYELRRFGAVEHKVYIDGEKVGTVCKESRDSFQAWRLIPKCEMIESDLPCRNWPSLEVAADEIVRAGLAVVS